MHIHAPFPFPDILLHHSHLSPLLLTTNNMMIGCFNENSFPVTFILGLRVMSSFCCLLFTQHTEQRNKKMEQSN
jgi:hypothetical protein